MHASRHDIGWLLAVLLAIATGVSAHAEDKTLLRAREGAAALMRGQYDKAVAAYDEALTAPEIADFIKASIYSDRGVAKWRMNQTKDAIEDFNKSIQLAADSPAVYNNRGNALMDLGHPDEAVKDFDRAITLSPTPTPGPISSAFFRSSDKSSASSFASSTGRTMTAVSCEAFTANASLGEATVTRPAPARNAPMAASLAAPVEKAGPDTTTA